MTADLCLIGGLVSPNINFDALKAGLSRSSWYMTSPMPASSISFVHSLHGCRVTYMVQPDTSLSWAFNSALCSACVTVCTHNQSINQSINHVNQLLKLPKWHNHWKESKDHWLGDVSKLYQDMIAGIKNVFNSRRKVDREFAATTPFGSLFQMSGAATAKARLPTVDSFTCGTTRRLVLVERSGCRPGKSSTRISGPIVTWFVNTNPEGRILRPSQTAALLPKIPSGHLSSGLLSLT